MKRDDYFLRLPAGSMWLCLGALAFACGQNGARGPAPGVTPGTARPSPVMVADTDRDASGRREVEAFGRIAREELARPGAEDAPQAREYLAGLPSNARRAAALAITEDADPRGSAIGIDRLVADGFENDAVPALGRRVAAGDDLTGFGYQWAHGEDESLPLRMYVKIARHLLDRLERYRPVERTRVERFLIDGGFAEPLPEFSKAAVEARLARISERAERRKAK